MEYTNSWGTKERPGCILTDQSGAALTNKEDIVIGASDSFVFQRHSKVIVLGKPQIETTLDYTVFGTACVDTSGDFPVAVTANPVKNTTIINEGHIEVHTKDLFEKYHELIRDPEHPDRPYKYLRIIVLNAGLNSQVINKGTIDVYFDHDPTIRATVYVMAMNAAKGSILLNYGTISFHGTGSVNTRFRGMATFGDNVTCINYGRMTADVACLDDARFITTGGTRANVINEGSMEMRGPGRLMGMTRYGDSNLINNGNIRITLVDYPPHIVVKDMSAGCAMFEPLNKNRTLMPPMINRGEIQLRSESTEATPEDRRLLGMFIDIATPDSYQLRPSILNDGIIRIEQTGPVRIQAAEAGFMYNRIAGIPNDTFYAVSILRWRTALRDFSALHDLFIADNVNINFGAAELILEKDENRSDPGTVSIAPESLVWQTDANRRLGFENYDDLKVFAADPEQYLPEQSMEQKTVILKGKDGA